MQVKLVVPNAWSQENMAEVYPIKRYGKEIAAIAGGFTASQATGGWIDPRGNLIVEPVTVFDCTLHHDTPDDGPQIVDQAENFRDLARKIVQELSQDCVYLSFDGNAEFVTK